MGSARRRRAGPRLRPLPAAAPAAAGRALRGPCRRVALPRVDNRALRAGRRPRGRGVRSVRGRKARQGALKRKGVKKQKKGKKKEEKSQVTKYIARQLQYRLLRDGGAFWSSFFFLSSRCLGLWPSCRIARGPFFFKFSQRAVRSIFFRDWVSANANKKSWAGGQLFRSQAITKSTVNNKQFRFLDVFFF
jgi:hypothetical protein